MLLEVEAVAPSVVGSADHSGSCSSHPLVGTGHTLWREEAVHPALTAGAAPHRLGQSNLDKPATEN